MPKSVLVVDDDAIVRQMLCCVLALEADFTVCGEAVNGREAIEKAQALRPDVILMDLSMPVMNG
jgi:chemotaxis response regulator CheB